MRIGGLGLGFNVLRGQSRRADRIGVGGVRRRGSRSGIDEGIVACSDFREKKLWWRLVKTVGDEDW